MRTEQLGEQLAECGFRPWPVQVKVQVKVKFGDSRVAGVPAYTGRLRLLNVVFDVFGYASPEPDLHLHVALPVEVERALLSITRSRSPSTGACPPDAGRTLTTRLHR